MYGFGVRHGSDQLQGLGAPAECRVIGDGEIEPEQADDRPDQTLGLTQGEAEYGAQRQCRRDRQGGVARLTARCATPLGAPGRDRRLAEPDG
jgi:hypothetical protein